MTDGPRSGRQRPRLTATVTDVEVVRQRAYLVGVVTRDREASASDGSLDELGLLTETAGSEPVEATLVRRDRPDAALFIGKGKAAEIASSTKALDIDVVVFDNELTPAQQRNLQNLFECDVVDRVAVILDIFAQHARSAEGKLQVELAQLEYSYARQEGLWQHLERLGGGVGTRGPGETQLESDRRVIRRRVERIRAELGRVQVHRRLQRKGRRRLGLPVVALVGYTNAGKTTLLNRLTGASFTAADQLFVTLDPAARRVNGAGRHPFILTDTVGFIRKLPHQLVAAFRATLEELADADVLLHVVDASHPALDEHMAAVAAMLRELEVADRLTVLVLNKVDKLEHPPIGPLARDGVSVSAATGEGLEALRDAIDEALRLHTAVLRIPHADGGALALCYARGRVLARSEEDEYVRLEVELPPAALGRLAAYRA
jgi:GTP-binding protein HflX